MAYRRLFIMRKDLGMSAGKLAAQVAHCGEAYWTALLKAALTPDGECYRAELQVPKDIVEQYLLGIYTKTICEAKSKTHLLKAQARAEELGLAEGVDYGLIYDRCLTELEPEEENGTTITGIWFRPLPDETAHEISRKYQLYR